VTVVADTDHSFALCLTHDVDKPFKTPFHSVFYALRDRDLRHLRALHPDVDPYWQFRDIMALEADLGVKSAFYFLDEQAPWSVAPTDLPDAEALLQAVGRYDVRDESIGEAIRELDDGGWEVGLHGSYHSVTDRERLRVEKRRIERELGHDVDGGRQHYLNLAVPETWRHYRAIGLDYDATLGSTTEAGFHYGYDVLRPFDDEFVVFPVTLMDQHLPDPGEDFAAAWSACESLLDAAEAHDAVMTVIFHPRYFSEADFPGFRPLYERLVREARARDAWIGAPRTFCDRFLQADRRVETNR